MNIRVTIRLDEPYLRKLERLCQQTQRSKSHLVRRLIDLAELTPERNVYLSDPERRGPDRERSPARGRVTGG